jgi:hypothetical protein
MFIFDFLLFVRCNLPPHLRTPMMVAWINLTLQPLVVLWAEWLNYYTQLLGTLAIHSGTDILQAALRVLYPTVGGFKCHIITVYDDRTQAYDNFVGEYHAPEFDYFIGEVSPPAFDFFINEDARQYDFIAYIPTAYVGSQQAIAAFLNRYRPAGHRLIIEFKDLV